MSHRRLVCWSGNKNKVWILFLLSIGIINYLLEVVQDEWFSSMSLAMTFPCLLKSLLDVLETMKVSKEL